MGNSIPPTYPPSNVVVDEGKVQGSEGSLEDEIASILAIGGGRSNIPIKEEYIPTPKFSIG